MPDIQLFVNRSIYSGWKEASVTRSIDAICGKFSLRTVDRWEAGGERWTIFPGNECALHLNGVPLVTGYVDKASPSYDSTSHAIAISGRDKTGDIVDCSVDPKISELRGLKLDGIIRALIKPFGLKLITEVDAGAVFYVFAIQPGESVWEAIERALKQRFMILTPNGAGDLVLADIGKKRAYDSLEEGVNIKTASADYDYSQRFSEYIVKGQSSVSNEGQEENNTTIESRAKDRNIKRYRPKVINAEMQASEGSAGNRAELEAATRAGKSTKITVTVQGWTMTNGELWPLNSMIRVKSPFLSADEDFLISETEFAVSDQNGTTTKLELTRPDAYLLGQGKGKKGKKGKNKKGVGADPWEDFE